MKIELLYFDDCPSWQTALDHLHQVLSGSGVEAEVDLVQVETLEAATDHRFVGSPTIRVDGRDLFPAGHTDYGLGCRVYQTEEGMRGWPTVQMLNEALNNNIP